MMFIRYLLREISWDSLTEDEWDELKLQFYMNKMSLKTFTLHEIDLEQ